MLPDDPGERALLCPVISPPAVPAYVVVPGPERRHSLCLSLRPTPTAVGQADNELQR